MTARRHLGEGYYAEFVDGYYRISRNGESVRLAEILAKKAIDRELKLFIRDVEILLELPPFDSI